MTEALSELVEVVSRAWRGRLWRNEDKMWFLDEAIWLFENALATEFANQLQIGKFKMS